MTQVGIIPQTGNVNQVILEALIRASNKKCFDALLIPVQIPSGDSYTYVLTQETSLLQKATPLPPVMSVQGGKVLSNLTKHERLSQRIAAVMRPCEIRAGLELYKLGQVDLENILLISIDCPGALSLSDYVSDPRNGQEQYHNILREWGGEGIRPVCQTCLYFAEPVGDLHIGILGDQENICLLPNSDKGQEFLQSFDALEEKSLDARKSTIRDIQEKREENKKKSEERLQAKVLGLNGLVDTFSKCIACHNCMKACPICYCRLCYFDSGDTKHEAKDYLNRAKKQGSLQFPADKLFFHSGRMSHMSLSCVGCGSCEDACPASIPVAQIFNFIGEKNQAAFLYQSGMNREEKIPLIVYKQEELEEFED